MLFTRIAEQLGLEGYPKELAVAYEEVAALPSPCKKEMIQCLQEEYRLFDPCYDAVLAAWEDLQNRPDCLAFVSAAVQMIAKEKGERNSFTAMPVPMPDGSPARDMLPLFVHICFLEKALAEYRARGFTKEEIIQTFECIPIGFSIFRKIYGRVGINQTYYNWISHYTYVKLFKHAGFNYELLTLKGNRTTVLKNKRDGRFLVLIGEEKIHRSGRIWGTVGFKEEEGAFRSVCWETEDSFVGNPVVNGFVSPKIETYHKTEWERILSSDDWVVGLHIPVGTDLSPENLARANASALQVIAQRFPDYQPRGFYCKSWLLEPAVESVLGRPGKISQFVNLFCRYPAQCTGEEMFPFVFGPQYNLSQLEEFPEATSLQKAFKAWYRRGNRIWNWNGILMI